MAKPSRYRVVQTPPGEIYVERKGWLGWHRAPQGEYLACRPLNFRTVDDAVAWIADVLEREQRPKRKILYDSQVQLPAPPPHQEPAS